MKGWEGEAEPAALYRHSTIVIGEQHSAGTWGRVLQTRCTEAMMPTGIARHQETDFTDVRHPFCRRLWLLPF